MIRRRLPRSRFVSSRRSKKARQSISRPSSTSLLHWLTEEGRGGKAMRTSKKFILATLLMGAVAGAASAQSTTQTADQTRPQAGNATAGPVTSGDQALYGGFARGYGE